jgi:hypothetical protein
MFGRNGETARDENRGPPKNINGEWEPGRECCLKLREFGSLAGFSLM